VVAAIQRHDITRQMNEHVQAACEELAARMSEAGRLEDGIGAELPSVYAGLTIQVHQLKAIKGTVANWTTQIRTCLRGIETVSATEVAGIGGLVLEQAQNVSSHLVQMQSLEKQTGAFAAKIQGTLGGLGNLMQMVGEHLQRSRETRDRLRLLALNSIVDASHLGTEANVILVISRNIKEVSQAWSQLTDESAHVMQEILNLIGKTNDGMAVFSEKNNEQLRAAQQQTEGSLECLRDAAVFTARQSAEMSDATATMQGKLAAVSRSGTLLESCFTRVDAVLTELESVCQRLEAKYPQIRDSYDADEMERLFSASYTTELERDVLRAALHGTALPSEQQAGAGNSVELF
jgi:hypothetical protein